MPLVMRPHVSAGLSFIGPGGATNVKFDGKAARGLRARALQRIERYNGRIAQTPPYELSPDLKTLTITARTVGHTVPNIFVFERQ